MLEANNQIIQELLIEPVWNQNTQLTVTVIISHLAFNRTSLESKLFRVVLRL